MRHVLFSGVLAAVAASADLDKALADQAGNVRAIYVDGRNQAAIDKGNAGDNPARPFKTIQAALVTARATILAGSGARVMIGEGVYREGLSIAFPGPGSEATPPLIIENAPGSRVVVSGSDESRDWRPLGNATFVQSWAHRWGYSQNPWPNITIGQLALRSEMVFFNGNLLKQVDREDDLAAQSGSFFVDESSGRVLIHVKDLSLSENDRVEVGMRTQLLKITDASNLTIRGIRFEHAVSRIRGSALSLTGRNIKVDNVQVEYNNSIGLFLRAAGSVVTNSQFNKNGFHGIVSQESTDSLFEDIELSDNNWRGALAGFYTWDPGNKQNKNRKQVWRRIRACGNQSSGLWFDYGNADIIVEDSLFCSNGVEGLSIEANPGPFTIKNNAICYNNELIYNVRGPVSAAWIGGLLIRETKDVMVKGNRIIGNTASQVQIHRYDDRQPTKNILMENNIIAATDEGARLIEVPFPTEGRDFRFVRNSYLGKSDNPQFWLALGRHYPNEKPVTFGEWKTATGLDENSQWQRLDVRPVGRDCLDPQHLIRR